MYPFSLKRIALTGVMLLSVPLVSLAQSTSTTPTSQASTTVASTTIPEVPALPPPVIDTRQPLLQPVAQTRITNLAANVSNRLDATVRRLTNVTTRLDSRIHTMTAAGYDTSNARAAQQAALMRLTEATQSLTTIDAEVAAFVGASDPLTAWVRLETIYGTISGQIVAAHTALRECVRLLEGASLSSTSPAVSEIGTSTVPE
jgi:hypothetical protein